MRILLLTHSFNALAQRLFVDLRASGHEVSVELDIADSVTEQAVALFEPELLIAPILKRRIPESIWRSHRCLVVHPGPPGDGGASSLDWAILEAEATWGVSIIEATGDLDAGPVWAHREFPMRSATKSSLYRREVVQCAAAAIHEAVHKLASGQQAPEPIAVHGRGFRAVMGQEVRAINWEVDTTDQILRHIRCADSFPGVRDASLPGAPYVYDARPEPALRGVPGALLGQCEGAVCRGTVDGAIWIGQMRLRGKSPLGSFKLAAATVLGDALEDVQEIAVTRASPTAGDAKETLTRDTPVLFANAPGTGHDLWYEEDPSGTVGNIHFPFYNGALSTRRAERLVRMLSFARERATRVIVLWGGDEFWSNGMDLNLIESAPSPADASWKNINAINDLSRELLFTTGQITIAAASGNMAAGGVFLALAADLVWAREGVILNPHYKGMGNLHGSEHWTYVLPRRIGNDAAHELTNRRLPMGTWEAHHSGLVDAVLSGDHIGFARSVARTASELAADSQLASLLAAKSQQRSRHEGERALDSYRAAELDQMRLNFFGFDPSYHVARCNFVYKRLASHTPLRLAKHRQ